MEVKNSKWRMEVENGTMRLEQRRMAVQRLEVNGLEVE